MEFLPKMNLICPNCKEICCNDIGMDYIFCLSQDCNYSIEVHKKYDFIKIRNTGSNLFIILDSNKLYITLLGKEISRIDYKPSKALQAKDLQEVLFDLFELYKKHERNLLFL